MKIFRHLRKNPGYTLVNIGGLSISMAACLLIFHYASYELSYDRSFEPNVFRLGAITIEDGIEKYRSVDCPRETAQVIREQLSEIVDAVRISSTTSWFDCTLAYRDKDKLTIFNENSGFWFAEQSFIRMFRVDIIEGDPTSALMHPYSIVLSASSAKKYFGNIDPLGRTMRLHGSFQTHDYQVTAIMKDFPPNSHLDVNVIASFNSLPTGPFSTNVYLQFHNDTSEAQIVQKLNNVAPKIQSSSLTQLKFDLERIQDIHLFSNLEGATKPTGNPTLLYSLLGVAVLILVIAWINYINLTSSKIVLRAREVGIYKVIGASRLSIIIRYLSETIVLNSISIIAALGLYSTFAPTFWNFIGISIPNGFSMLSNLPGEFLFIVGFFFAGMLLSGIIPAWTLAQLNPVRVLKGRFILQSNGFSFRKAAVVFQFTCAFALAIVVIVFYAQFDFMRRQELGISIDRSLVLKAPATVDSTYVTKLGAFKNELMDVSMIESVSTSSEIPGNLTGNSWSSDIRRRPEGELFLSGVNVIDPDYISLYKLKLIAGRNFTTMDFPGVHFGNKIEPIMLNRMAIQRLGFSTPDGAIDQEIFWGKNRCVIIGILEDFHSRSVKEPITPMLFTANIGPAITLKLAPQAEKKLSSTVKLIHDKWDKFFPSNAFEYFLLEDHFNAQYANDEQVASLFKLFCGLAITISLLGLFALSLFSLHLRRKEISIRKILGSSIRELMMLLSKEYLLITFISVGFSMPLAWLALQRWLEGFSMHINLSAWHFFLPLIPIFIVIVMTLSWQVLQVERNCSVELLKDD